MDVMPDEREPRVIHVTATETVRVDVPHLGEVRAFEDSFSRRAFIFPASHHWPSHVRVYPPEDQ